MLVVFATPDIKYSGPLILGVTSPQQKIAEKTVEHPISSRFHDVFRNADRSRYRLLFAAHERHSLVCLLTLRRQWPVNIIVLCIRKLDRTDCKHYIYQPC